MILKLEGHSHQIVLYDNVDHLIYTKPNTYYPAAPLECRDDSAKLEEFILDPLRDEEYSEGKEKKGVIFGRAMLSDASIQISTRKVIYIGEFSGGEIHCCKIARFFRGNKEYIVYTQLPIYVCDDSGKTIEVIK